MVSILTIPKSVYCAPCLVLDVEILDVAVEYKADFCFDLAFWTFGGFDLFTFGADESARSPRTGAVGTATFLLFAADSLKEPEAPLPVGCTNSPGATALQILLYERRHLFNIHFVICCDVFLDGPQRRATWFTQILDGIHHHLRSLPLNRLYSWSHWVCHCTIDKKQWLLDASDVPLMELMRTVQWTDIQFSSGRDIDVLPRPSLDDIFMFQ